MKRLAKRGSPSKIDIRGVASHARVSIATVSRTINHVPTVDAVLADRVWRSIAELNYLPNTQARALVSGKSKLLGLIISEITNPFFPELIQEFEQVAVENGYELLIASTNYDLSKMELCVRRMLERKVDGVAIMTFGIERYLFDRFAVDDVPVTFIDAPNREAPGNTLVIEYNIGISEGIEHLSRLGHVGIGFISGPLRLPSAEARKAAFLLGLGNAGLPVVPEWLIEGDHTLDGGRDAMLALLKLDRLPTAVMCSNDMTAIGVQHALFEANLKVPDDLSLIGFDDIHLAEYTIPPLTTVRMSCREIACAAIGKLLVGLEKSDGTLRSDGRIGTKLILRQTTGVPADRKN